MMKNALIIALFLVGISLLANEPVNPDIKNKANDNNSASAMPAVQNQVDFIYPVWGFYLNFSPGMSQISNDNLNEAWQIDNGFGYSFSAGAFKSFGPYFKVIAGLGISSVQSTITANGNMYSDESGFKDIDGDIYAETLTLHNAEERTKPTYLSVPILLEIGNPNIDKVGFYLDLGVRISSLLNKSSFNTKTGKYETYGLYEQYGDLEIMDVPELGFYGKDRGLVTGNEYAPFESYAELNAIDISIHAGAGIAIPISSNIIFKGGIVTHWGLTDISGAATSKDVNVTKGTADIRHKYIDNSFASNAESFTRHFGLEFGIYINRLLK